MIKGPLQLCDCTSFLVVSYILSYFFVYAMDLGIYGVWYGVITGNVVAAIIALIWVRNAFGLYAREGSTKSTLVIGIKKDLAIE